MPDRVVEILIQICDALIAAHNAGVIHRDLKLDNVFLVPSGDEGGHDRVKLLDWGIAKEISNDVRCTIDGQLVGTPQYLSPEQARGAELTPATDTYSLGVMAFELFLEQLPFEAETAAEIMTMHLREAPPKPSDLWPDIPHDLEHLLLAMLAKRADERPSLETVAGTLLHVRDELDRRRSEPAAPVPSTAPHAICSRLRPRFEPLRRTSRTRTRFGRSRSARAALVASAALFMVARDSRSLAAPPLLRRLPWLATPPAAVTAPTIAVAAAAYRAGAGRARPGPSPHATQTAPVAADAGCGLPATRRARHARASAPTTQVVARRRLARARLRIRSRRLGLNRTDAKTLRPHGLRPRVVRGAGNVVGARG